MDTTLDLANAIYHGADMSDAEKAAKLYELLQRRETNHARSMELARAHIRHHVDADARITDYEAAVAAVHRALDEARIAPADCGDSQCVGSVVKRVRAVLHDQQAFRTMAIADVKRMDDDNEFLREWLRGELTLADADIDEALRAARVQREREATQ